MENTPKREQAFVAGGSKPSGQGRRVSKKGRQNDKTVSESVAVAPEAQEGTRCYLRGRLSEHEAETPH